MNIEWKNGFYGIRWTCKMLGQTHCPLSEGTCKTIRHIKNEREGNFLNAIVHEVNGDRDKAKRGVPHAVDQVSISCEDTIVEKRVSFY